MSGNRECLGEGPDDGGREPYISRQEIEQVGFLLTFLNLPRTAVALRKALLGGQSATILPALLLEWLREAQPFTARTVFEQVMKQVRQVVLNPATSPADAAYELRLTLNRLFADVRSRNDVPLETVDWTLQKKDDDELADKDHGSRRGFFREILVAILFVLHGILQAKTPTKKNEA